MTSAITLAEVTRRRGESIMPERRRMIEDFFENDYIALVEVDRVLAQRARALIWEHGALRPNDAIHLASAIATGCGVFYTYDDGLKKLAGQVGGLRIEESVWRGQASLEGC